MFNRFADNEVMLGGESYDEWHDALPGHSEVISLEKFHSEEHLS